MTDTTASSASPQPQENGLLSSPQETRDQFLVETGDEWETVAFPGQLSIIDTLDEEADRAPTRPGTLSVPEVTIEAAIDDLTAIAGVETAAPTTIPAPENLVQLVQDLNQCNDALLLRVTELEEALERSQVALQSEIERHQSHPVGLPLTTLPGPVQQQIAQLLSELDIANDSLRRTTIHNETLQAELDGSQQRVAQLERECTLLQQRFSDKTTALHQAEETCRDLKARLHRQQRYTLQFKAALEKYLNMAPGSNSKASVGVIQGQLLVPVTAEHGGQPMTMPRSQQIQPWSAGTSDGKDFASPPNLTQLLRGLRGVRSEPAIEAQHQPPSPPPETLDPRPATTPAVPVGAIPQTQVTPGPTASLATAPDPIDPWIEEPLPQPVLPDSSATALFTEPSPWGQPLPPVPPAPVTEVVTPSEPMSVPMPVAVANSGHSMAAPVASSGNPMTAPELETPPVPASPTLPAYLGASDKATPSPLVYPLRSQKKIKSLGAVELPSFGRNVRRR
jgi:hypothetical protein